MQDTELTRAVLAKLDGARDPRVRALLRALVTHLHALVRETELTEPEWLAAMQFLTATGRFSDDKRREFILLSDVLGVSMLVDALNHRKPGAATESTVLGPFYVGGAPELPVWGDLARGAPGEPAYVSGRVLDLRDAPIAGALLDVWQTDGSGTYDVQRAGDATQYCRGRFTTAADGCYGFRTVKPASYPVPSDGPVGDLLRALGSHPYRPAHIHLIASAASYESVATHIFVAGDPYLDSDAVFGVKPSLIVPFERHGPGRTPAGTESDAAFYTSHFDIRLAPITG